MTCLDVLARLDQLLLRGVGARGATPGVDVGEPARGPSNPATSARRVTLGSYSVDVISIPAPPRWLAYCDLRVADDFLARWLALTGTGRTTRNWNLVVVVGPVDSYGDPDPADAFVARALAQLG